ncbi:MAG: hypothetical protein HYY55_02050 [Candidatus Niyogibacteria bacterium]|nr:MAG: hypothetical protein HYY55_02050 [Candidatus Niyogibacteria bacterium]
MARFLKNIKVKLDGRGELTIHPSGDHVATGGEGSIYRAHGTAVKLYLDSTKMSRDDMAEKIKLLSGIKHEYIVAPKGLVFDERGKVAGFYMDFVEGEPFMRLFTNDFRARQGFTDKDASILTDRMRETISFAHSFGAILVDPNELNWKAVLARNSGPEPRIIDVDSWQIARWPARAIMPSIRDWHSKDFNKLTDWFSWGVVSFQIYTGIHPYKGTLDGFERGDLERRMKANASVFSPGVRLNRAVRDFSVIPGKLLDWYVATFQNGQRSIPPSPFDKSLMTAPAVQVKHAVISGSGLLICDKIFSDKSDKAIRVFPCGVVLLESGRLIDLNTRREIGLVKSKKCEVVDAGRGWLKADYDGFKPLFSFISAANFEETELSIHLNVREILRYENRIFAVIEDGLCELVVRGALKPVMSAGNTWGATVNSITWFDGAGIQNAMGASFIIAPFGDNACAQVRVRELDGLCPISAKAGPRFISIVAVDKNGQYQKIELSFDKTYASYRVWHGQTDDPDINIAILPKGVCAAIVRDGELDVFVPATGNVSRVQDGQISTEMALTNIGDRVLYIYEGEIWSARMK